MALHKREGKRRTRWKLRLQHEGYRLQRTLSAETRAEALRVEAWAYDKLLQGYAPEQLDTDSCSVVETSASGPRMTLRQRFDRALERSWYKNRTRNSVYARAPTCSARGPIHRAPMAKPSGSSAALAT